MKLVKTRWLSFVSIFLILGALTNAAFADGVYFSMTVSPERLENVSNVFADIKDIVNSDQVTGVVITIPRLYRNKEAYDEDAIVKMKRELNKLLPGKVEVRRVEKDLGPITKMLPAIKKLQEDGNTDATVISLDDDQRYQPKSIQRLITYKLDPRFRNLTISGGGGTLDHWPDMARKEFPGKIGTNARQHHLFTTGGSVVLTPKSVKKNGPKFPVGFDADIIEGYAGVAYTAKDVNVGLMEALADEEITNRSCRLSDDLIISYVLALENRTRMRFTRPKEDGWDPIELNQAGALQKGGGLDSTDKARLGFNDVGQNRVDSAKYLECLTKIETIMAPLILAGNSPEEMVEELQKLRRPKLVVPPSFMFSNPSDPCSVVKSWKAPVTVDRKIVSLGIDLSSLTLLDDLNRRDSHSLFDVSSLGHCEFAFGGQKTVTTPSLEPAPMLLFDVNRSFDSQIAH